MIINNITYRRRNTWNSKNEEHFSNKQDQPSGALEIKIVLKTNFLKIKFTQTYYYYNTITHFPG